MPIRPEEINALRGEITKLTAALSATKEAVTSQQKTVEVLSASVVKLRETVAVVKDRMEHVKPAKHLKRPCIELKGHLGEHAEEERIMLEAEANAKASAKWSGVAQIVVAAVVAAVSSIGALLIFFGRIAPLLMPAAGRAVQP